MESGFELSKSPHSRYNQHMFNYIWPLLIIVFANTLYQICAKGIPAQMNTYASMTITWSKVLGVAICLVGLYFINKQ